VQPRGYACQDLEEKHCQVVQGVHDIHRPREFKEGSLGRVKLD
jgi:hypothetical protein